MLALALLVEGCRGSVSVPRMADGIIDTEDTLTLGLSRCPDMQWAEVFRSEGYVNNAVLTRFKGRFYCMWQQSERDEDTPDTRVMFSVSQDGISWVNPSVLALPDSDHFASPGGWIQRGDSLVALVNYTFAPDRSKGGKAFLVSTFDGINWNAPSPVLMADGTPVEGIFEQDPLTLPDGRIVGAVHFQPGTKLCPVYTDDPSGVRGWKKAVFPEGEGLPIEPSQYMAPDGTLVMFMRDQQSSFVKLYSLSADRGESWTAPQKSDIPDSRSKQCTGTLPDGRTFWVGNPTGNKSRRALVLATSSNGYLYDRACLLAGPEDLPPRRKEGRYKTLGYNYPKAFVQGDTVWVSLSVNKENVAVVRIINRCGCHYWKGADIGWATEYESRGLKFYNRKGEERECTALMKELGLDAVRFRVWVDPSRHGNWNGKEDLLVKARRAKDLGMAVMVDFHYSDFWADPKKQNIPASWSGKSYEEVKDLLAGHTRDVLEALKAENIEPKWVQVGNEISNGFLWTVKGDRWGDPVPDSLGRVTILESMGHLRRNPSQYAGLFAAGYDAVKEVFPKAKVIVHLDNGFHQPLYDSNLDTLRKYGARWDIIGMSLYPYWALDSGLETNEEETITHCMMNIAHVWEKYHTPVMIVETGFEVDEAHPEVMEKGRDQLRRIIRESKATGHCEGIFYWEPECRPFQYKLGAFDSEGKPTVIMDGFNE